MSVKYCLPAPVLLNLILNLSSFWLYTLSSFLLYTLCFRSCYILFGICLVVHCLTTCFFADCTHLLTLQHGCFLLAIELKLQLATFLCCHSCKLINLMILSVTYVLWQLLFAGLHWSSNISTSSALSSSIVPTRSNLVDETITETPSGVHCCALPVWHMASWEAYWPGPMPVVLLGNRGVWVNSLPGVIAWKQKGWQSTCELLTATCNFLNLSLEIHIIYSSLPLEWPTHILFRLLN